MSKLIIIFATLFAVIQILNLYGVFERPKGVAKVKKEHIKVEQQEKKHNRERQLLEAYKSLANIVRSTALTPYKYDELEYLIRRLDIRCKTIDRCLTPDEWLGKQLLWLYGGIILIIIGVLVKSAFIIMGFACICVYATKKVLLKMKVDKEDKIIADNFNDLFSALYSTLKQGSKARISHPVESYLNSLRECGDEETIRVMGKLGDFLLNNLYHYEDHVAVPKLKERYRSATVVNFCNVATQALTGVDNGDNLLMFRQELMQRKELEMNKKFEKRIELGSISVYALYIILFILIIISWRSKLPLDMIKNLGLF